MPGTRHSWQEVERPKPEGGYRQEGLCQRSGATGWRPKMWETGLALQVPVGEGAKGGRAGKVGTKDMAKK